MKTRLAPVVGKVQMAAFWNLPKSAQHWPCTKGSLTQKIKQNVKQFSVQLIHQKKVYLKIAGSHKTECYWERQVVLWGDGQALIEATTHIKAAYCRKYWPFFDSLGTKSLGSQLFVDPKIKKVRMKPTSSSQIKNHQLIQSNDVTRHSRFTRGQGQLDLFETFLPAIYLLK